MISAPFSRLRGLTRWSARLDATLWLRWSLASAVAIGFAVWALYRWNNGQAVFDDSFISFRYAENLVRGRGLVFNAGERVEGYTNFLWVLVAATAIRFGRNPLVVTRILGVASYLAVVVLATLIAARPRLPFRGGRLPGLALVALLVVPPDLASFAGTGLETSFVALLVVAIGVVHHLVPRQSRAWKGLAALLPLVALLTRLDLGLAVGASAFASGVRHLRSRSTLSSCARDLIVTFGPAAVGLVAYLAWQRFYYGDFLPNTFYAKAADHAHVDAGVAYVQAFVESYPSVLLLVLFAVAGLFAARRSPRAAFLVYGVTACALQFAYAIRVGGDFMEYRFMWEYWPLLVCVAIVGADGLSERAVAVTMTGAAITLGVGAMPAILEKTFGMQSIGEMSAYARLGEEVGTALGRSLPPGTVVATTLAGMSYFMPDVTTIDQWGLNDRFVAHLPLAIHDGEKVFNARGHLKYAPMDYLQRRGVNLFIQHPVVCECDHLCREDKPDVFVRLKQGNQCLRSWYMTETPELTKWFCGHPELFVLDHVSCSGVR